MFKIRFTDLGKIVSNVEERKKKESGSFVVYMQKFFTLGNSKIDGVQLFLIQFCFTLWLIDQ